ncbi:diguanylate cyclase [Paracoccus sp. (in: a-proteobacteria)]|uniref:diguanylate cyclase n=1 Tax=Paracoccus sp. TaxID=267 RepID=UPI0040599DA9
MSKPVIMIVDDEIANIEIMGAVLGEDYEICFSRSGEDALRVVQRVTPDLILLDIVMPGLDGYEVCRKLKDDPATADIPVIFTTGLYQTEDEVRGLAAGAIDYVTKPIQPVALRSRVDNHIELKRMRDQLANLAMTDGLTGLGNRRLLEKLLQTELRRLSREGDWLSFIMLDIDFFKQFNDLYGHLEGDQCLRKVASALGGAVRRSGDTCLRYGGEEFACILPRTDHDGALEVAEDMRRRVEALGIGNGGSDVSPVVTVSIGVASGRCSSELSMELWISTADAMLYQGKRSGRNRVEGHVMIPASGAEILGHGERREAG